VSLALFQEASFLREQDWMVVFQETREKAGSDIGEEISTL
jgi:hypothetical protein